MIVSLDRLISFLFYLFETKFFLFAKYYKYLMSILFKSNKSITAKRLVKWLLPEPNFGVCAKCQTKRIKLFPVDKIKHKIDQYIFHGIIFWFVLLYLFKISFLLILNLSSFFFVFFIRH